MIRRVILFSVFCVVLVDCTDDRKLFDADVPWVKTEPVQGAASESALFQGAIFNAKQPVTELGFVWALLQDPLDAVDAQKTRADSNGQNSFSIRVTSNINARSQYYVRAYAVSGGVTFYGNVINFFGAGGNGTVIDSFAPKSARAYDTITITGRGFGPTISVNRVVIGLSDATITYASPNLIKAVVPFFLPSGLNQVSVFSGGQQSTAAEKLQFSTVLPGKVVSSNTSSIGYCDFVILTYSVKLEQSLKYSILFNDKESFPGYPAGNTIFAQVPAVAQAPAITLRLKTGDRVSDQPFTVAFRAPQITSFSPSVFSPSAEITAFGQNLGDCFAVSVNGKFVSTYDAFQTSFKFRMPDSISPPFKIVLYKDLSPIATYNFN